jgi:hypothetical protein
VVGWVTPMTGIGIEIGIRSGIRLRIVLGLTVIGTTGGDPRGN